MASENSGNRRKWWRNHRLDTWRRKASHLIYVEYAHDLLPVVPAPDIVPPISDDDAAVLLEAARHALTEDLTAVAALLTLPEDSRYVTLWPGEHYRLLAGLARVLKPALAVEVGTYKGAAAAVLSAHCDQVITFDITPITEIPHSIGDLTERFENVSQVIGDLIEDDIWQRYSEIFEEADLVFIDGPKDGHFEHVVVPKILERMKPGSVMVLDDIRFAGMRGLWVNGITRRRIDIGCLGHWSGTGVIFL
jgi:predicted O-methyltransferase YrrM